MRKVTEHIVLHTAAWPGDPSAEDIRRVHVGENGWSDIGYHFVIRKDGSIEAGRAENEVGAHCRADRMNYRSIGICLSGHHDHESLQGMQRSSLFHLCLKLMDRYEISPDNVIGHREAGANKTCPGKLVDMDKIRKSLQQLQRDEIFGVLGNLADDPATLPIEHAEIQSMPEVNLKTSTKVRRFLAGQTPISKVIGRLKDLLKHFFPWGPTADRLTDQIGDHLKNPHYKSTKPMNEETFKQKLLRYLKQPSTKKAILGAMTVAGLSIKPEMYQAILLIAGAVWSAIEGFTDEDKKKTQSTPA